MALAQAVRSAIGLGCRRGVEAGAVVALVRDVLGRHGIAYPPELFSIDSKSGERGLADAAHRLGARLVFLPRERLAEVSDRAVTRSARVTDLLGLPSVAEAAALAGAGPGAVLAGPRLARNGVTCALAWTGQA